MTVDPDLLAGNRRPLRGYEATHFLCMATGGFNRAYEAFVAKRKPALEGR